MRKLFHALVPLMVVCACSAPGANDQAESTIPEPTPAVQATPIAVVTPAPQPQEKPMSEYANKIVELHTGKGVITVRTFPDRAPNHVRNFVDLAEKGFYNGTKFHRVIPGFMIQGGDPLTKESDASRWGTGGSGKNIAAEFNPTPHRRGILSMARSNDPNSASSQFFVVVADSNFLDNNYTVFGEVLSGMDVADQIVSAPKGPNDRPNEPVAIDRAVVREATPAEMGTAAP